MTALIIIASVVLVFAVLFRFSIRAELKYHGGQFDCKVKYMFFTIYPAKKKKTDGKKDKKAGRKRKKDSKEETASGTETENTAQTEGSAAENSGDSSGAEAAEQISEEDSALLSGEKEDGGKDKKDGKKEKKPGGIGVKIQQGKILWNSVKKALIKLFRKIYITDFVIDITAGGADAFEAAMNYGKLNAVVYNAISAIRVWFPVSVKTVDINCDFNSPKSVYDGECAVRLTLGTALAVALTAGVGILKNWKALNAVGESE